jgi:hypothetical protein
MNKKELNSKVQQQFENRVHVNKIVERDGNVEKFTAFFDDSELHGIFGACVFEYENGNIYFENSEEKLENVIAWYYSMNKHLAQIDYFANFIPESYFVFAEKQFEEAKKHGLRYMWTANSFPIMGCLFVIATTVFHKAFKETITELPFFDWNNLALMLTLGLTFSVILPYIGLPLTQLYRKVKGK